MSRRILYLQYTNPAGYPPLLHSAAILAEEGWQVLLVGAPADGAGGFTLPAHERITCIEIAGRAGVGAAGYAAFAAGSLRAALRFRPHWCYASDALSTPAALAVRGLLRTRLLYHEHDTPSTNRARRLVSKTRRHVAARAQIVVAPSVQRLNAIPAGRGHRLVVWNCPRRDEARAEAVPATDGRFRLVYHGSLSRDRLTPQFVDALRMLPDHVQLEIYGYETAGHRGYVTELMQRARTAGLGQRVRYHGAVPERADLLRRLRGHQLGIATVVSGADANLDTLAGASNKAFEYLALGIPLLISAQPAWQQLYQVPGYAVDCQPTDPASIARAVRALLDQPERARQMSALGRARILKDWNYETQFAPVLQLLSA